jgi:hypothetical protein
VAEMMMLFEMHDGVAYGAAPYVAQVGCLGVVGGVLVSADDARHVTNVRDAVKWLHDHGMPLDAAVSLVARSLLGPPAPDPRMN